MKKYREILSILIVICVVFSFMSCSKIKNEKNNIEDTKNQGIADEIKDISDSLKGQEIKESDLKKTSENKIFKIVSEKYEGEVTKIGSQNSTKIETGIVVNEDTNQKYSLDDLFNINDDFVNLVINKSNEQVQGIKKEFLNNFDKKEWTDRLEFVSKENQLSYFIFDENENLQIFFDVPNAYGTYMNVASIEKDEWINFVKDKSLFE